MEKSTLLFFSAVNGQLLKKARARVSDHKMGSGTFAVLSAGQVILHGVRPCPIHLEETKQACQCQSDQVVSVPPGVQLCDGAQTEETSSNS